MSYNYLRCQPTEANKEKHFGMENFEKIPSNNINPNF